MEKKNDSQKKVSRKKYIIPTVKIFICILLAGILLSAGCERKPRMGFDCTYWNTSSADQKVYGIHDGSAYFGGYQEGTAIIIWTDSMVCNFSIKSIWDKTSKCVKYSGYFKLKSSSAPKINVECYVSDRMKGSLKINQQEYDLANGSLFLISFRSPQIRIGQINQDIYTVICYFI